MAFTEFEIDSWKMKEFVENMSEIILKLLFANAHTIHSFAWL